MTIIAWKRVHQSLLHLRAEKVRLAQVEKEKRAIQFIIKNWKLYKERIVLEARFRMRRNVSIFVYLHFIRKKLSFLNLACRITYNDLKSILIYVFNVYVHIVDKRIARERTR